MVNLHFLQNLDSLCTEQNFRGGICGAYAEEVSIPVTELKRLRQPVTFHEGFPDFDNHTAEPCLFILDDLLTEAYSRQVCEIFTRRSHHKGISVIPITQNLFHQGRYARDISLNATYLVLLKNVRDKNQFSFLARQIFPEASGAIYEAYLDATRKPHGYIILDFAQNNEDRFRFRTNIFPDEYPPIIYAPVDHE